MTDPITTFTSKLRHQGQKVTTTRLAVFKTLLGQEPLSMHEIYKTCEADRASVYRTIKLFEQLGIVQRLQMGWKYKLELSDAFHQHHHHLTCLHCGVIIPLQANTRLEKTLEGLAANEGFEMKEHQIEIQGICASCRPV